MIILALALDGCALTGGSRAPPSAADRGHQTAQRACAACHAVEPGGVSPRARAPAFASLEMRHTAGLEGRVADLTRHGHYAMPTVPLTPEQARDIVIYIESLDPGRPGAP